MVSLLLKRGADVNLIHSQGGSALMEAATVFNASKHPAFSNVVVGWKYNSHQYVNQCRGECEHC